MLMSQPRIFFAMSRDGLLPQGVSKVHPRFGTPYITTIITCVIVALVAGVTQIQVVGEMTSIGTLFAFVVVCGAVLMLRVKRPEVHRPFRVPFGPVFPVLGILSCVYLMLSLPVLTWVRFLVWLDLGMLIYWFYGRTHSPLADSQEAARRTPLQSLANFVYLSGALAMFNFACITVLGFMTEVGLTTETWPSGTRSASPPRRPTPSGCSCWRCRSACGWWARAAQGLGREVRHRWRGAWPAKRAPVRRPAAWRPGGSTARRGRGGSAPSSPPGSRRSRPAAGRPPGLGIVLAGADPASEIYVRNKLRTAAAAGCRAELLRLAETASLDDALAAVERLNARRRRSTASWCSLRCRGRMGAEAEQRVFDAIDPARTWTGSTRATSGCWSRSGPSWWRARRRA